MCVTEQWCKQNSNVQKSLLSWRQGRIQTDIYWPKYIGYMFLQFFPFFNLVLLGKMQQSAEREKQ